MFFPLIHDIRLEFEDFQRISNSWSTWYRTRDSPMQLGLSTLRCPTSYLELKHGVSEANSASIFRRKKLISFVPSTWRRKLSKCVFVDNKKRLFRKRIRTFHGMIRASTYKIVLWSTRKTCVSSRRKNWVPFCYSSACTVPCRSPGVLKFRSTFRSP